MSIIRHRRIQPANHDSVVEHLSEVWDGRLSPDVSSYAQGRKRAWLNLQPSFGRNWSTQPAFTDERLSSWLNSIMPVPWDLALISRGAGIRLHRDATYAQPRAFTLNLGAVAVYQYEPTWLDYRLRERDEHAELEAHAIGAGELIEFNCKNRHAAILDADADKRWSINLWQLR